jgi:hypothetical protein
MPSGSLSLRDHSSGNGLAGVRLSSDAGVGGTPCEPRRAHLVGASIPGGR